MILEAPKHLEHNNEEKQVDSDKDDMDTEMVIHDNAFDTLSNCEQFYQKFKATTGKEVFALFTVSARWSRYEQNRSPHYAKK